MANVEFLLDMRDRARRAGDRGIYLATTADLARIGYVDPTPGIGAVERVETPALETTAVRAPERAVPNRGGRPALPRCAHNKIVGRCNKCPKP